MSRILLSPTLTSVWLIPTVYMENIDKENLVKEEKSDYVIAVRVMPRRIAAGVPTQREQNKLPPYSGHVPSITFLHDNVSPLKPHKIIEEVQRGIPKRWPVLAKPELRVVFDHPWEIKPSPGGVPTWALPVRFKCKFDSMDNLPLLTPEGLKEGYTRDSVVWVPRGKIHMDTRPFSSDLNLTPPEYAEQKIHYDDWGIFSVCGAQIVFFEKTAGGVFAAKKGDELDHLEISNLAMLSAVATAIETGIGKKFPRKDNLNPRSSVKKLTP